MIIVETERLTLRNWREDDRNLFREINRDEKVVASSVPSAVTRNAICSSTTIAT